MADLASAREGGFRTGMELAQSGVGAYENAKKWSEMMAEKAEAHEERAQAHADAAQALKVEADRYKDTQAERGKKDLVEKERADTAETHAKKQDELIDAEISSIKKGSGKNGTGGNKSSPALLALREQYKQLSNDMRQKTQPGSRPPLDLIQRYNAVGKALNAQAKHEEPDSVNAEFVPIPEPAAPAPGADGVHPLNWLKSKIGLSSGTTTAPIVGADDYKQFEK